MFEISFSNVLYSKKDKHSIGVWLDLTGWTIANSSSVQMSKLIVDLERQLFENLSYHLHLSRSTAKRVSHPGRMKSTLTEQRNIQSDCDCGFDLDQSTVDIYALHIYMIWWPSRLAYRVFSNFLSLSSNVYVDIVFLNQITDWWWLYSQKLYS